MSSLLVQAAIFVASVACLGVGARALVDAVVRAARSVGLSELTIGLTVVAMGTSTPELVVTADAAATGLGDIAVGNVVGSNVYNIAVVLGGVALLRVIPVEPVVASRDSVALAGATLLGAATLFDATVTRAEGALLVLALAAYLAVLLRTARTAVPAEAGNGGQTGSDTALAESVTSDRFARPGVRGWDVLLLGGGLAVVLVGGHYAVESASAIARSAGLSDAVVGATVVAAGTSTPEFAVSLVALQRGSVGVSVGNVFGSNVFNVLGIMGAGALVRPLAVSGATMETLAWLLGVTLLAVIALRSGRRLSRPEGAAFVCSEAVRWTIAFLR